MLLHARTKRLSSDSAGTRKGCRAEKIAHTKFVNHGDVVGGGTLGSILSTSIPAMTVDLGVPILAMHSSRELMARSSQLAMDQFAEAFFK